MEDVPDRSRLLAKITTLFFLLSLSSLSFAQTDAVAFSAPWVQILILLVLLVLSGLFSGSETALTAIGEWKIRQLREEGQDPTGAFALLQKDRTRFITTLLIGNNLVNIAATALVTQIAINLSRSLGFGESLAVGYATGVMTLLVLVFGEITPKSIAVHHAVGFSRFIIRPVYALSIILYPIGLFFTWVTTRILRLFRLEPSDNPLLTENELRLMLRNAEESGVIEAQEEEMINGIIDLEETVVREVMTPRVDIIAIDQNANLLELLELNKEQHYSRLPVFEEKMDNIKGIVYTRDLLDYLHHPDDLANTRVSELMTQPQYVPETVSILALLKDMRTNKNHLAIVVDEFGGTSGLVTLEDIIEEITGEIYDETDLEEEAELVQLGDNEFRVQASIHLDELADIIGVIFDDEGDYDTLGGFITSQFGYIPDSGESHDYQGKRFTVEQADERRVISVLVTQTPEEIPAEEPQVALESALEPS
ncbi:MAG: HlyC/CorC family transporter [Trueperaceae bacterium]|nr:HlyC/CorC family transporter [Trueperaceae bacterium]